MRRRAPRPANAVAAALRKATADSATQPHAHRPHDPDDLSVCVLCHRDFVTPVEWEPVDERRWWMFIRCAECGTSREVTVPNAVAARYDAALTASSSTILRAAQALERERFTDETETFVAALDRDLIGPADFVR